MSSPGTFPKASTSRSGFKYLALVQRPYSPVSFGVKSIGAVSSTRFLMPSSNPRARPTSSKSVGIVPMLFFSSLAQFAFQHLAGRRHGQCLAELNDARVLVVG